MQPRTKRQREVLEYITSFIQEKGYEPSYQQIARFLRIASKSAIAKHIKALENQGLLSRIRENGSFGLQILPKNQIVESVCEIKWLEIPFPEQFEKWELEPFYLPKFLIDYVSQDRLRAFRVQNDAMLDEHICEGDIVLVEKRSYARDGDNVVVFIENTRVVLKKYFRSGANVELRPSNEAYHSIHAPADKISIQGVVRGLLRLGG
jgi:repressor LexA